MNDNIRIRKARPEDNQDVTAFAFEIMRDLGIEPDPGNIDHALAEFGREKEIAFNAFNEFVAVDEERPVGSIILKPISPSRRRP